MMKRILSLALALVLLVSLFTPGILPVTTSAAGENEDKEELNIEVKLVDTAVLYTSTNMVKSVNLVEIPEYSTTVKVRYSQRVNGILWYLIDTTRYDGTDYVWYCYVKASDAILTAAVGVDRDDFSLSSRDDKQYITATAPAGVENGSAQWQINIPGTKKWANIRNDGNTLTVSYGLVAQLLDENHQVQLRVRWTEKDIEYFSKNITVTYDQPETSAAEEPAADIALYDAQYGIATYADGEENPDVKKTYNIVVNYVFENNNIVAYPYTASLTEGSSFSATVTFPKEQGYLPYVGETQQNSMELEYTSVTEDVTINVVYKPTNVNYKVIHYQQNVGDDKYTIVSTETKQGLTGSQVPAVAKTFEGFYSLLYERPAIAADGSTVIEVYYDRYYYLMNFDMDGGYGTEPVYTRYDAPIGEVTDPTKAGYTFEGWSETKPTGKDDEIIVVENLPTTMPAESKTYYAIWTPGDKAKVTAVFWGENADDEKYSYLSVYTKEIYLKPGSEFTYSETGMQTCGKETHTHTDKCYNLNCDKETHEHNSECYTCGNAEHKHSVGCYPGAGSGASPLNPPDNPKNGQVYSGSVLIFDYSYIYISGSWYNYSGSVANGSTVSTNCNMTEHTHTTDCIGCGKTEHIHTRANCYTLTCKEEEHTHSSSCYEAGVGMDSTLWRFVKSDTITVAADGSSVVNVYYDRVEYSVQFYNNQSCSTSGRNNEEYTDLKITAKWGENILSKWPTYNGSSSWYVKDKSNTWQNSIQVMPVGGAKFWGPKSGNSKYTATYYVEILDDESYDEKGSDGRYYKVHHTDTSNSSGNVTDEERYGIDGFNINNSISTSNGTSYGGSKFYYTRNSYKLTFNDGYNDVKTESVKYQALLGTFNEYEPEVPSQYEPGSVKFGGWYQNPQCTGEEYKLDEHTMPANDIILYAKWNPVVHVVEFYLTEFSTERYWPTVSADPMANLFPHDFNLSDEAQNELSIENMNKVKPNGDYTFIRWYYYENGVKKSFTPSMPITKDLKLYGEWSSNIPKQYTIQYVLKSDHRVKVAKDDTGSGLAGTTKTFDAKGGTELYAAYQEGYFPTVQSQSLLLDIESNSLVITFEYVPKAAVPYTVMYVEKDTGNSLADDKVVSDNRKAVVTETFVPISGYMPDAYQKRLVVTAEGENILFFYYSKDETHAYYKITHYTKNADGETWTEYSSSQAVGDIGTRYHGDPMTIPGFTYNHTEYVVNKNKVTDVTAEGAELTADGLEIKLYYVPNVYLYQVRYLEQGSGKVLCAPKNGSGRFGQVISESAIDIEGYDKVNPTSATLSIRIDEGEGAPNLNIITFYYKEQEVTIDYVAVGPTWATNFGSVAHTTETVKVNSGTAQGSTPTAGDGFKFVGWYKDAACTEAVDVSWVSGNKIVPQKTNGKNVSATYYAKFEYDVADLTITKTGCDETLDANQTFIFTITGPDNYKMTVVIKCNGSVTIKGLKVGSTYTIHEENVWSWRYSCEDQIVTLRPGQQNKVTMENKRNETEWLDGNAHAKNEFDK